jgi:hypothetical protein
MDQRNQVRCDAPGPGTGPSNAMPPVVQYR